MPNCPTHRQNGWPELLYIRISIPALQTYSVLQGAHCPELPRREECDKVLNLSGGRCGALLLPLRLYLFTHLLTYYPQEAIEEELRVVCREWWRWGILAQQRWVAQDWQANITIKSLASDLEKVSKQQLGLSPVFIAKVGTKVVCVHLISFVTISSYNKDLLQLLGLLVSFIIFTLLMYTEPN